MYATNIKHTYAVTKHWFYSQDKKRKLSIAVINELIYYNFFTFGLLFIATALFASDRMILVYFRISVFFWQIHLKAHISPQFNLASFLSFSRHFNNYSI